MNIQSRNELTNLIPSMKFVDIQMTTIAIPIDTAQERTENPENTS